MKTVVILEGWAGGPKLSKSFAQALKENGFEITKNVKMADIIFAHSTGCYMLPATINAQHLILLDPPYWPGRSIVGRWIDLMKTDTSLLFNGSTFSDFLVKKFWEIYYIFAKPSFTWSVFRNQSKLDFLEKLKDKELILIRNIDDQFCSPKIKKQLKNYKNVRYLELAGNHEDYYSNPRPYIDLLLKEI